MPGPMEQALIGMPIADPQQPVEVLRVIHSFDPCLSCAVHVMVPERAPVVVHRPGEVDADEDSHPGNRQPAPRRRGRGRSRRPRPRRQELSGGVVALDVGTAILDALPEIEAAGPHHHRRRDAGGGAPGTVYRFRRRRSPQRCSPPCTASISLGCWPGRPDRPAVMVFGVEPDRIDWSLELSAPVAAALPALLAAVRSAVAAEAPAERSLTPR